jgi:hypothetical protein
LAKQDDTGRRELRELRGVEVEAVLVLGVAGSGTVNSRSQAADQLPELPISGRDDLHDGLLRADVPGAQRPRLVVGGRATGAA